MEPYRELHWGCVSSISVRQILLPIGEGSDEQEAAYQFDVYFGPGYIQEPGDPVTLSGESRAEERDEWNASSSSGFPLGSVVMQYNFNLILCNFNKTTIL